MKRVVRRIVTRVVRRVAHRADRASGPGQLLAWVGGLGVAGALLLGVLALPAQAEYGDVILNRHADREGVRPVVFPHWFHRIRFRCKVCHQELGFEMRAGANDIKMTDIIDGRYCGLCHNGQIAWGPERCELCHSGLPGLPAGIVGGAQTSGPGRW